jgi:hypothetical protein
VSFAHGKATFSAFPLRLPVRAGSLETRVVISPCYRRGDPSITRRNPPLRPKETPASRCPTPRNFYRIKILLREAEVAVSPGVGFGEYGEGYVRIGLVENEQRIRQAARRMRRLMLKAEMIVSEYSELKEAVA